MHVNVAMIKKKILRATNSPVGLNDDQGHLFQSGGSQLETGSPYFFVGTNRRPQGKYDEKEASQAGYPLRDKLAHIRQH